MKELIAQRESRLDGSGEKMEELVSGFLWGIEGPCESLTVCRRGIPSATL